MGRRVAVGMYVADSRGHCYWQPDNDHYPTREDDFCLIATAPKLLFAAEQALMAFEEGYDTPKVRDDLRLAIAEARGKGNDDPTSA